MTSPPTNCSNCGALIFSGWWSASDGAYRCQACGTLNAGVEANFGLGWGQTGCLIVWGIVLAFLWISYLNDPNRFDGGETGIFGFMLGLFTLPWLILLVIAVVSFGLARRRRGRGPRT